MVDSRRKQIGLPASIGKELKELMRTVLKTITKGLLPSVHFKVIIKLLRHANKNVRRKVRDEVPISLTTSSIESFWSRPDPKGVVFCELGQVWV